MGRSAIIQRLDNLYRKIVRTLKKGRCQICGKQGTEVHHLEGRTNLLYRWDIENLALLCKECHYKIHNQAGYAELVYRRFGWDKIKQKIKSEKLRTIKTEELKIKERETKMKYADLLKVFVFIAAAGVLVYAQPNQPKDKQEKKDIKEEQKKIRPPVLIPPRVIGWRTRISGGEYITEPIIEPGCWLYDPNDPNKPDGKNRNTISKMMIEESRQKTQIEKKNERIQNKINKKNFWILNRMKYNKPLKAREKNGKN